MNLMIDAASKAGATRGAAQNVSPETMKKMFKAAMEDPAMKRQFKDKLSGKSLAQMINAGGKEYDTRNPKWHSPVTFSVQDPKDESRLIFSFRGLGWKLTGLEVPESQMARMMGGMGGM